VEDPVIHVTVTFLGLLRDQMGASRLDIVLPPGARLRDLLDTLAPQVEGKIGDWAWDRDRRDFTSSVIVSRGHAGQGKDGELNDGEEIVVLPPMAGG
jgi:molybdopterin converting factor small subunit